MSRRLDGELIQPRDLTPDVYEGVSIVENIVLASSNHLRSYLGLREDETIAGPVPKFVTRKNPSLDNYFAELLLRTCYNPVNYLPTYEEHVIRGSQMELPSALNPRLVGAVLIGIGGQSTNPDFKKVYDEHAPEGTRRDASVTRKVFNEHISRFQDRSGVQALEPMLHENDIVDSKGGVSGEHLNSVLKSLNVAQFRQPGFVAECLDPQWKRAILGAILASVCVCSKEYESFDNTAALLDLERELDLYRQKLQQMVDSGFLYPVSSSAVDYVKKQILRRSEAKIEGKPSYFTPRRILFGLRHVWHERVASFVMGFLFEAMLQSQESFLEVSKRPIPMRSLPQSCVFVYYEKQPRDLLPQRGILATLNEEGKKGKKAIVVVNDPVRQITAVFRSKFLPKNIWERCVGRLIEKEGAEVWYVLKQKDGTIANFALNGTESFVGVPISALNEEAMYELFRDAITA